MCATGNGDSMDSFLKEQVRILTSCLFGSSHCKEWMMKISLDNGGEDI